MMKTKCGCEIGAGCEILQVAKFHNLGNFACAKFNFFFNFFFHFF